MDCFWMFELPAVLVGAAGFPPQQAAAPYSINRHQRWLLAGKRLGLGELSHRRAWAWAHGNSFGKRSLWRSLKTRKPERNAQCQTTQYSMLPDCWAYCTSNPSQTSCGCTGMTGSSEKGWPRVSWVLSSQQAILFHILCPTVAAAALGWQWHNVALQVKSSDLKSLACSWATLHALSCLNRNHFPAGMF